MSLRWTAYVAPKPPEGAQKRKVTVFRPKFKHKSAITSKRYEIRCQYRHQWPWMTLNGIIVLILRYFTEFDSFGADCVTVVENRPKMFFCRNRLFPFLAKTNPPCSAVSLRQLSFLSNKYTHGTIDDRLVMMNSVCPMWTASSTASVLHWTRSVIALLPDAPFSVHHHHHHHHHYHHHQSDIYNAPITK